ncbi:rod shape-determining protein RodA [Oligoflexia bacterium]|nr:rod shape-determining protein RodA [Oligoflexia bacterium]
MFVDRRVIAHFDWGLLLLTLILPTIGLAVLYSAGYDPEVNRVLFNWLPIVVKSNAFFKQLMYFGCGLVALLVGLSISGQTLSRYAYVLYGICVLLLVGVFLFGTVAQGSRRWLTIGAYNLQPSELMKLGLILGMARYLSKNPPKLNLYGLKELIVPLLMLVVPMGLIIQQPDLGTALAVGAIGLCMILFMGIRPRLLVIMAVVALIALIPAWSQLENYQKRRILVLLNPEQDSQGDGWHIIQSKIAVGSGQFMGKGFLKGTQTQLEFLPERTTDFIFSVLAEEAGFVGSLIVLLLYLLFIYKILKVVVKGKDLFSSFVCFGVAVMIFFHTVVNIGMVMGLLPIVGLPLPLLSYGGSSLLSTMFAVGLVLGVRMRRLVFVTK